MKTAPPDESHIDSRVATAARALDKRITRRGIAQRVGIGVGAAALLGIGGTGAATAFFPHYLDMQGVVKTAYVDRFVDCVRDAGWNADVLGDAEAAPTLESWGADPAMYSVVTHHLLQDTQGQAGRAIGACQLEIADEVGEPITPTF